MLVGRNVLVTGAAGFLGRHFVEELHKRRFKVVEVDDMSGKYSRWFAEEIDRWQLDVREYLNEENVEDFDFIFHFAAPVGGREKIELDPLFNADSLSIDTHVFRTVAASARKPTIIYPSSSAVYPIKEQNREEAKRLSEALFNPFQYAWGKPDEMYGFTKMAGEVLAAQAEKYGVNTLAIRPFSGYGEDQPLEYPMSSIVKRAVAKENPLVVWGPGNQTRDFIHVDDIVRLTMHRVEGTSGLGSDETSYGNPRPTTIKGYEFMNLATGVATSFVEVARIAAEVVGYKPDIACLIDKPYGVMHRVGEVAKMQGWTIDQPRVTLRQGIERMVRAFEAAK